MKAGSPFGPFWNYLGVEFSSTQFYNITYAPEVSVMWQNYFPPSRFPVLAFKGAPATFPVTKVTR